MSTIEERLARMRGDTDRERDLDDRLSRMRVDALRSESNPLMDAAMDMEAPRTISRNPTRYADLLTEMAREEARRAGAVTTPDTVNGKPRIVPRDYTAASGSHRSGKFDDPYTSRADYANRRRAAERMAAAFQPTSDMYLNPVTAAAADDMQKIADRATKDAEMFRQAETHIDTAQEEQRKKTNRAFRTANAFMPVENQTPEAWDQYSRLYDEAVREEEILHDMGGRSARELPGSIARSFGAGVVGATRGIVNQLGYYAQGMEDAQLTENAEMWRRMGREDYARDMEQIRDSDGELTNWANFGEPFLQRVAEENAGYGEVGQTLTSVSQAMGGMLPSQLAATVTNLFAPGAAAAVGLGTMFLQASGNATEEAKRAGASDDAAKIYGTAVGTVEVLTEKMFGGIPALGVGAADDAVENLVKRYVGDEVTQQAVLYFADALGENIEEFTSEWADYFLNKWLVGSDERTIAEVGKDSLYSGFLGFLTSIFMSSPGALRKMAATQQGRAQLADMAADYVAQQAGLTTVDYGTEQTESTPLGEYSYETPQSAFARAEQIERENLQQQAAQNAETVGRYAAQLERTGEITPLMADTLNNMYSASQDFSAYAGEMTAAYNAGRAGTDINSVATNTITPEQRQAAYLAGQGARNMQARASAQQTATDTPAPETGAQAQKKPAVRVSNPGFVQDEVSNRAKLTHLQKRALDTIGKTLGVRVRMVESITTTDADGTVRKSGAQGYYDNGEIVLARDADDPFLVTAVHESVHRIRELSESDYAYLSGFVTRNMSDSSYGLAEIIKGRDGYTTEEIPEEIIADAFGRMLGNEKAMRQLVAENSTAAQRIMDVFADIFDRIKTALTGGDGRALTENQKKVYQDLAGRFDVMMKYYQDAVANVRESEGTANGVRKNAIRTNAKGQYVQADRQVIYGNDPDSWGEQVTNYINGKIRAGEDVTFETADGDLLTLTRTSAEKLGSQYDGHGRTLPEEVFEVKANAAVHIDELIKVAKGTKWRPDELGVHEAFAKGGFNYKPVYFRDFDNGYYKMWISIPISETKQVYNLGGIEKRTFPGSQNATNGSSGNAGAQAGNGSSGVTVTQDAEKSNPQNRKHSLRSTMATLNLHDEIRDGKRVWVDEDGKTVTRITPAMVKRSGVGALIDTAAAEWKDSSGNVIKPASITAAEAEKQVKGATDLMNMVLKAQDGELVWRFAGSAMFSAVKSNSDGQYGTTIDFSTVCRKTQEMMTAMSKTMLKLGRGLTKDEVIALQRDILEENGTVPCPVCYVFSRWAGVGGILDNMLKWQQKYGHDYDSQAKLQARMAELRQATRSKKDLRAHLQENDAAYADMSGEREALQAERKKLTALRRKMVKAGSTGAVAEIDNRLKEVNNRVAQLGRDIKAIEDSGAPELAWLERVRSQPGYWTHGNVPANVLFNLDDAATFAEKYPVAWGYRTSRGPSAGKAILPYSDMRLGDMILGPKNNSAAGNTTFQTVKDGFNDAQRRSIKNAVSRTLAQNLIGGQRYQSTSDFRYDYGLDYLQTFWEAQALGSKMQTYTKVIEFAEIVAAVGGDCNLSVMPLEQGYENGRLKFSAVTGMDIEAASKANAMYDNVQLILVGINDEHIRLALSDDAESGGNLIGFVIPYHASGASINNFIRGLVSNLGESFNEDYYKDYSEVQNDAPRKNATAEQKRRNEIRTKILTGYETVDGKRSAWTPTAEELALIRGESKDISGMSFEDLLETERRALAGDKAAIREYESWSAGVLNDIYQKMWMDRSSPDTYGVRLNSKQAEHIMPHEYWFKDADRSHAYLNGFIFRSYCYSLGLTPRFTGLNSAGRSIGYGDFSDSPGYWKTLIDRPMYANDGTYREQQKINITNLSAEMLTPEYGERNWGGYRVAEPDEQIAEKAAQRFADRVKMSRSDRESTDAVMAELEESQRKNYDFNQQQTEVGSTLRTLGQPGKSGSQIKRSKYGVGKDIGGTVYLHRDYATDVIPAEVYESALQTLQENYPDFQFNCVEYNPKDNTVRFDETPGFDTEREPVVGDYVRVNADGTTKQGHTDYIWHHKWLWVKDDYKGFNVRDSWEWSKQWLSTISGKTYDVNGKQYNDRATSDGNGIDRWNAQLDAYGLPRDEDIAPVRQAHTSRGTSINVKKVPALYSKATFQPGTVNIDIGAGVEGTPATAYLKDQGVDSMPFDPFNRSLETNKAVTDFLESGEQADTATCSNCLNVIDNADARANVILQMAKAIKPDGTAYFTVYENKANLDAGKAGEVKAKPDQWQEFRDTKSYVPEIGQFFDDVKVRNGLIIARSPKPNLPKATWQIASTEYTDSEGNRPYTKDQAVRFSKSDRELLDAYIEQYGAIDEGERPARKVPMPKRTTDKTKLSMTVRTVAEAGATPETFIPTIENLAANHEFDYTPYSDEAAISNAAQIAEGKGWSATLTDWVKDVSAGGVSKTNTAVGWALYNNAVNAGDTEAALNVLRLIVQHQRNAAQAVQATRILKQLNPETQLYNAEKTVESLQDDLRKRYGKKAPDLQIDNDLAERFLHARTKEARDAAMSDIYKDIGRQMPTTFLDRWNAWRYLAMLGNPRTHVRNIVGNAGFMPVVAAKDLTATAIESAVNLVTGGKIERTKGNVIGRGDLMKAAWNDYENVRAEALGEGKYNDRQIAQKEIQDARKIFGNTRSKAWNKTGGAALEAFRKANSIALDAEDVWFSKPHYTLALAQYCAANHISAEQIARGEGLAKAREYAIKEAQKATYRDTNDFSQMVSRLGRGTQWGNSLAGKAVNTLMEGVLPFRKTPANILVRGIEYSPIGLMKALTYDTAQVSKGNMTAAEMIDDVSAGLTGTGLMALGAYLVAQGLLRGRGGSDDKKKKMEDIEGHQEYAIELPDGTSITLDWLAPEALPVFVGANIAELMQENNDTVKMADILSAIGNVTEPMLQMSMLQSLNDIFEAVGYAKEGDLNALTSALSSSVTSYLTQAFPTLLGQVERSGESGRMQTYTDKNQFLTGDLQYTIGKISAKLPWWDYNQIPYIDAWGREELTGKPLERAFNNFINPAFVSKVNESDMEKELMRVYEATGESVFPQRPAKFFNVNGERKDLTGDEYVQYATQRGQTSYALVGKIVETDAYKQASDAQKAEYIKDAYTYADQTAKTMFGASIPDSHKWVEKAQTGKERYNISPDVYLNAKYLCADVQSLKDRNGNSISNSSGLQKMEAIYSIPGLNDDQRRYLFECFGVGTTVINYNRAAVSAKLKEMRKTAK